MLFATPLTFNGVPFTCLPFPNDEHSFFNDAVNELCGVKYFNERPLVVPAKCQHVSAGVVLFEPTFQHMWLHGTDCSADEVFFTSFYLLLDFLLTFLL